MPLDDTSKGLLRALLLGPGTGLELANVIGASGPMGPKLRAMERNGLLESWNGETTLGRGGFPRRYYKLTDRGREEAEKETD